MPSIFMNPEDTNEEMAKAFSEKRLAIILVDPNILISSYNQITSAPFEQIAVPAGESIPADAQFVSCEYSHSRRVFEVLVCHPSFDPAPLGSIPVVIGWCERIQVHKLVDGKYVPA